MQDYSSDYQHTDPYPYVLLLTGPRSEDPGLCPSRVWGPSGDWPCRAAVKHPEAASGGGQPRSTLTRCTGLSVRGVNRPNLSHNNSLLLSDNIFVFEKVWELPETATVNSDRQTVLGIPLKPRFDDWKRPKQVISLPNKPHICKVREKCRKIPGSPWLDFHCRCHSCLVVLFRASRL